MPHKSDTPTVSDPQKHSATAAPKAAQTPAKSSAMAYQQGFASGAF